jgi:hypothetical protein
MKSRKAHDIVIDFPNKKYYNRIIKKEPDRLEKKYAFGEIKTIYGK